MDEFVCKAAGIGLPAIVLLIMMATTGLAGAAAITAALAMLGPGGMIGGLVLLGIIGLASEMLTKYGLDALLSAIYKERINRGEQRKSLYKEISNLPITGDLKRKLKEVISC